MRHQVRPAIPQVLVAHAERWNRSWAESRTRDPAAKFTWYEVDGQSCREHILPVLKEMTQGHCSFCDAWPLEDRSMEPIEHLKPKSRTEFYHLAYSWENLYYACERCQSSKGSKWDGDIVAPDDEGYRFEDFFLYDLTTGGIGENPVAALGTRQRASATISIFALDTDERRRCRRLELRKWQRSIERNIDEWSYRNYLETGTFEELTPPPLKVQGD